MSQSSIEWAKKKVTVPCSFSAKALWAFVKNAYFKSIYPTWAPVHECMHLRLVHSIYIGIKGDPLGLFILIRWWVLGAIILNKSGPFTLQGTIDALLEHENTLQQQHENVLVVCHDQKPRSPAPTSAKLKGPEKPVCSLCKKPGHTVNQCWCKGGGAEGQPKDIHTSTSSSFFIIDSGASAHICAMIGHTTPLIRKSFPQSLSG